MAVPATAQCGPRLAEVRARSLSSFFSGARRARRVERRHQRVVGDVAGRHQFCLAPPQASTKDVAQRVLEYQDPADERGLMTEAASAKALSSISPDETPSNMDKSNGPSPLMSASSNARTEPSRSLVVDPRSTIRVHLY